MKAPKSMASAAKLGNKSVEEILSATKGLSSVRKFALKT